MNPPNYAYVRQHERQRCRAPAMDAQLTSFLLRAGLALRGLSDPILRRYP